MGRGDRRGGRREETERSDDREGRVQVKINEHKEGKKVSEEEEEREEWDTKEK